MVILDSFIMLAHFPNLVLKFYASISHIGILYSISGDSYNLKFLGV